MPTYGRLLPNIKQSRKLIILPDDGIFLGMANSQSINKLDFMKAYILDTNIFNRLLDGRILFDNLPTDGPFFATNIQKDEINNTKDDNRRKDLLHKFHEIANSFLLPTETFVSDVSHVDADKCGGGILFNRIKKSLNSLNNSKRNNIQDALIAEVSIINNYCLVTADKDLASVTNEFGGKVLCF